MKTYAMSMMRFAISTPVMRKRKILDEEVVAILDRIQGQRPDPDRKHDLDDDGACNDRAERQRQSGDLREERVAIGVLADELVGAPRLAR